MKFCPAKKTDGMRCNAPAGPGGLCYFHDPTLAKKRAAARRLGGQRRRVKTAGKFPEALNNLADVRTLFNGVMKDLLAHENSAARARLLISLGLAFADVYKVGELEARIAALEKMTEVKNAQSNQETRI
jgi:uncharacterized small protein (DUF1192 family)